MRVRELKQQHDYRPIYQLPCTYPDEKWLPVSDSVIYNIKPCYYVSNYGKVYYIRPSGIKEISKEKSYNGYVSVTLFRNDGSNVKIGVHRLILMTFCPLEDYTNMQVNHIDGNKENNWIGNLEWCTPKENIVHAHRNGLCHNRSGEDVGTAKITNGQADMIGKLLSERKLTHREIAELVGCSENIVKSVSNGSCWNSVYQKYNLKNRFSYRANNRYSPEEINKICQYFQDNYDKFNSEAELFRNCYKEIYGTLEISKADNTKLYYIYTRKKYREISKNYVW